MAEQAKDTIYVDIDDEITGIIDKVKNSSGKIIALVLPKRASVFQSIVNMKLLKRAADQEKKNLVLITSETGLLPLAGAAGVHVARTLTSKPEIPQPPQAEDDSEEMVDESGDATDSDLPAAATVTKPAAEVAALAAAADGVETIELDDDELPEEAATVPVSKKDKKAAKVKKDSKLHVPNFERFRVLLVVGVVVLIALIVGAVFALNVLPKAKISITTDASNYNVNLNLTADTTATSLNSSTDTLPAKTSTQSKTYTEQVATTGEQNNGQEATGTVTMSSQSCAPNLDGPPPDVPAGTGVSSNGETYITQSDASFTQNKPKGSCITYSTNAIGITAQAAGTNYNTSSDDQTFTVADESSISAVGSANGGTDDNVQVVSQTDINNAMSKISTSDDSVKQGLESQLSSEGYYPLTSTYTAATPVTTDSAQVGAVASTVTVTEAITYTMFGVHESDLTSLIDNAVNGQINTSKQSILTDGLGSATFNLQSTSATSAVLSMQATATAGPELNTASLAKEVAGMKAGDIKSELMTNPDVTGVTVKFSPFWVSSAPKKVSKITIDIAKPTNAAASTTNANNP